MVPKCSLSSQFPWQKVNLLVEYEHTVEVILPNNVPHLEHVILKCVSHSFPGLSGKDVNSLNQGGYIVCIINVRIESEMYFLKASNWILYINCRIKFNKSSYLLM